MTFLARMQADGWTLLQGEERNELLAEIAPNSDGQYRRGVVTLSLSNGSIHEGKHGVVGYFDETGLILNAILVEAGHRHQGHGRRAMQSLIAACNPKKGDALRLKLEAGWIGRGFVDEAQDLGASELVAWYQSLGFVLDAGSSKCLEYKPVSEIPIYDFGIPRENEPDWDEMRVDSIAAWILKRVPDNQMATCVRAISTAYATHTENWGASAPDPVLFLRYEQNGVLYECNIHESEDDSGNFAGPIVTGEIALLKSRVTVGHDYIHMPLVSDGAAHGLQAGKPASTIVDIEPLKGRLIGHAENDETVTRVILKKQKRQLWVELFPGWT